MTDSKYGIIEQAKPQPPVRELLVVPHEEGDLIVSHPAFGANTYRGNLEAVGKTYSHPRTGEEMHFRSATTSESISAVAYDFEDMAKPKIFDPRSLQAGYIVRTQDGVFTNTTETSEVTLKKLFNGAEEVNGIYIVNNMAFVPSDTFLIGFQSVWDFARNPETNGLARGLELSRGKTAPKLEEISSKKHYKKGVNVLGFDAPKEPIVRVVSFNSDDDGLVVYGDSWDSSYYGDDSDGLAFGAFK